MLGLPIRADRTGNGKMLGVPSAQPTLTRRSVLVGSAALAVLGVGVACGEPPPTPELDDLVGQLDRARSDSQLAGAAAEAAPARCAPALTNVASERSAHADALGKEIDRIAGEDAPTSSLANATSTTTEAPAKPPTTQDVVAALRDSANSATELATSLSGYQAGLLGSIAAACTAAYTVALTPSESPS